MANNWISRYIFSKGLSMLPTLSESNLNELREFEEKNLRRGAIVTYDRSAYLTYTGKREKSNSVIKRIVGLPGESIYNDRKKRMDYVPKGYVYAMGDNRAISADSRDYGPVRISAIDLELVRTLHPTVKRMEELVETKSPEDQQGPIFWKGRITESINEVFFKVSDHFPSYFKLALELPGSFEEEKGNEIMYLHSHSNLSFWSGMLPESDWLEVRLELVKAEKNSLKRGSVITFARDDFNDSGTKTTLFEFSRIVGLPGDLVLNDRKNRIEKVPENTIFVMGDVRDKSVDSRDFGVVDIDRIEHRVDSLEQLYLRDLPSGKVWMSRSCCGFEHHDIQMHMKCKRLLELNKDLQIGLPSEDDLSRAIDLIDQ